MDKSLGVESAPMQESESESPKSPNLTTSATTAAVAAVAAEKEAVVITTSATTAAVAAVATEKEAVVITTSAVAAEKRILKAQAPAPRSKRTDGVPSPQEYSHSKKLSSAVIEEAVVQASSPDKDLHAHKISRYQFHNERVYSLLAITDLSECRESFIDLVRDMFAEESIYNDEKLSTIINKFSAIITPGSIKPI